jgi:pSer/pThr/pTyr-binding forkhead associated (FHA) protein
VTEADPPLLIGRGSKADIFLYCGEHPSFISREHAYFSYRLHVKAWHIEDKSSVNGVFVLSEDRILKVSQMSCTFLWDIFYD